MFSKRTNQELPSKANGDTGDCSEVGPKGSYSGPGNKVLVTVGLAYILVPKIKKPPQRWL